MIRRELIIFPGALGDLICLTPVIRETIRRAAGVPVDLMARRELARFSVDRIGIARGHSIDRPEVSELFTPSGADSASARAVFGNFQRIHCFFASADLQFRSSLSSIVPETGFYPFRPCGQGHVAAAYLREIGIEREGLLRASLRVLRSDRDNAGQIVGRFGLRAGQFFLIFPGSGSPRKNWPVENFVRLAESLAPRLKPLIVIGPAEMGIEALFGRREIATVSGEELGTVAGLASISRFFIGNDSGASHLAAASGARGVVLFGPTDPERWRPLGKIEVIQREPMAELTIDEVTAHLIRLIENGTVGG